MHIRKILGFTLMELLIALVIIGILAAIAVPVYLHQVRRSRRTDAIHTLLAIQLAEEKYRMNNTSYGTLAQVWSGVTTSQEGYYNLAIEEVTPTYYSIVATAIGDQANDEENGTSCATMTLTYSDGATTRTPADCWLGA